MTVDLDWVIAASDESKVSLHDVDRTGLTLAARRHGFCVRRDPVDSSNATRDESV